MNISGFQYNLNRKTLEIYLSGCLGYCPGCHNEELWDFSIGYDYRDSIDKIKKKIETGLVESIWILGGDPLDQNWIDLKDFIKKIKELKIEIWLWTRYELESIPDDILCLCDFIKTGDYKKDLQSYIDEKTGIELASTNQKIIRLEKS